MRSTSMASRTDGSGNGSGCSIGSRSPTYICFGSIGGFQALDLPPTALPHLAAHHDRMMQRRAVKKTCEIESAIGYELPDWFPGATR